MKKLLLLLLVCCSLCGVAHGQRIASIKSITSYYYYNHAYRLSNSVPATDYAFVDVSNDTIAMFLDDTTAIFYTNLRITSLKRTNRYFVLLGTARDEDGVLVKVRQEIDNEEFILLAIYRNNVKTEYKLKKLFQ